MSLGTFYSDTHPIDVAETLAKKRGWDFDRVNEEQIAMMVEGQWQCYSLTMAWNQNQEMLRFICTFEIEVPDGKMAPFFDLLNRCNDLFWTGAFTYWVEQKLMTWRYGLLLSGDQTASPEQIDHTVASAVKTSDRFYPAFQLVVWSDDSPAKALQIAMNEAYGRA